MQFEVHLGDWCMIGLINFTHFYGASSQPSFIAVMEPDTLDVENILKPTWFN